MYTGSQVIVWKQDPWVPQQGRRLAYLPQIIEDGPKDQYFEIVLPEGQEPAKRDPAGDFLLDPKKYPFQSDAVHVFAVASQIRSLYQRALRRAGIDSPLTWHWSDEPPLTIKIHGWNKKPTGPIYSRLRQEVLFPSFPGQSPAGGPPLINGNGSNGSSGALKRLFETIWPRIDSTEKREIVHTCQSFDLIAHEVGHAVLDGLKPSIHDITFPIDGGKYDPEVESIWESFSDLTAIFALVSQLDQCEAAIAHSRGDLTLRTFLPTLAERYGYFKNGGTWTGLRNAINDLTADLPLGPYDRSQVLTGAVYDILVDLYRDELDVERYDPAETLFRAGRRVTTLFLGAILEAPDAVHFEHIAEGMIRLERRTRWKKLIEAVFIRRKIL